MGRTLTAVATVAAAVGILALAACTPTTEASPTPIPYSPPAILGETVSDSPLEAEAVVIAARAGLLGLVLAKNAADFSIQPFTSTFSVPEQDDAYDNWILDSIDAGLPHTPLPGPPVLFPLSIDVAGETTVVTFCEARGYWENEDPATLITGREAKVSVVRLDGKLQVVSRSGGGEACDATGAPIARFDPAPEPLGMITEGDVVPPPTEE